MNNIFSLFKALIDLIFPPRCAICKKFSQEPICSECLSNIKYIDQKVCKACGKPYDKYFEGDFCHDCYLKKTPFDMARSVAEYDGTIKEAIHRFKFNNSHILKRSLGNILSDYLKNTSDIDLSDIDLIIPIPLSQKKLKTREYNQATLLSEELSKHTGITINDNALTRTRETTPQFDLTRKERLKNLKDAFKASDIVKNKILLLIDDIYTTGSTLKEASNALKKAGANKVYALTLARTMQ